MSLEKLLMMHTFDGCIVCHKANEVLPKEGKCNEKCWEMNYEKAKKLTDWMKAYKDNV